MANNLDELKQIVTKSLESKGILGKIRARLRMHVFEAIDGEEENKLVNERLQSIESTVEKKIALNLVREFLQYYQLDYTASVLKAEAQLTDKNEVNRELLSKNTATDITSNGPLLENIILSNVKNNNKLDNNNNNITNNNNPTRPNIYNNQLIQNNDLATISPVKNFTNTYTNNAATKTENGPKSILIQPGNHRNDIKRVHFEGEDSLSSIADNSLFNDSLSSNNSGEFNNSNDNKALTQQYQSVYTKASATSNNNDMKSSFSNTLSTKQIQALPTIKNVNSITLINKNNNNNNNNTNNDEDGDDSYADDFQDEFEEEEDMTLDISISDKAIETSMNNSMDQQYNDSM